jgi:hypothetical protein
MSRPTESLPALSGTFQNIELAIIHAIHILSPFSKHSDDSCRCKDIYSLVRDALIQVDGQVQHGNHRFALFSSALCGRRSAARLFLRVADRERSGSWWKLKIPFEEAIVIASSLQGRPAFDGEERSIGDIVRIPKAEAIRSRFSALTALSLLRTELLQENQTLTARRSQLEQAVRGNPGLTELQTIRARIRNAIV